MSVPTQHWSMKTDFMFPSSRRCRSWNTKVPTVARLKLESRGIIYAALKCGEVTMTEPRDVGGRIAANFRRANIAEGLAGQILRPMAAIAPVPREEVHGVDFVGMLKSRTRSRQRCTRRLRLRVETCRNFRDRLSSGWIRLVR